MLVRKRKRSRQSITVSPPEIKIATSSFIAHISFLFTSFVVVVVV